MQIGVSKIITMSLSAISRSETEVFKKMHMYNQ